MKAPYPYYVLGPNGVVFILPRKCASNSIKHAVQKQAIAQGSKEPHYIDPHYLTGIRMLVMPVRNPLERFYSCYRDKIRTKWMPELAKFSMYKGMPLDEFAAAVITANDPNPHFAPFSNCLNCAGSRDLPPIHYLRVEHLERDWHELEDALRWQHLGIDHRNRTSPIALLLSEKWSNPLRAYYRSDYELCKQAEWQHVAAPEEA